MTKEQFSEEILQAEKSLYYIAKTILHNDEDCADAMQNAILSAYSKLDTLQNERYFKTWITRILINECYSMMRKWVERVPYEEYMVNDLSYSYEPHSVILDEVKGLPESYRIPFVLHYIGGYSVKEIAKCLETTENNVKVRLHRARKMLRLIMKGEL